MDKLLARGRIAPSPTGRMHLGNAFAFLMAFCSVKSKEGSLVLRIEDIDPDRSRLEFEQGIIEDITWLGISYDEGPLLHGNYAPYRQSERNSLYKSALCELERKDLIYPCFCTRNELKMLASAPHNEDGSVQYPGTCRILSKSEQKHLIASGKKACMRLDVEKSMALCNAFVSKGLSGHASYKQGTSYSCIQRISKDTLITTKHFNAKNCGADRTHITSFGIKEHSIEFLDTKKMNAEFYENSSGIDSFHTNKHIKSCESKFFRYENTVSKERGSLTSDDIFERHSFLSEISPVQGGDFALMRSDGVVAYQLAVVVDDIAMKISEVVRGDDLEESTPRQKLLYHLLGASPPSFYHFPLLCDHNGDRLAKRHKSMTLASLREQGVRAEAIIGYLGFIAGLIDANTPMSPMELVKHWDKDKIKKGAIVLSQDPVKELCS